MAVYAKGSKGRADRLFSQYIRARDGVCVECGSTDNLQCAHILSRRFNNTRTDENNAVTLCARHHMFFTGEPVEWGLWVVERMGREAYDELFQKAHAIRPWRESDWKAECARLEGLIAVSLASGATQA